MLNHITDATRAQALRLVGSGRLYDLGRVLDEHTPAFPERYFRQTLVTTAHHSNGGGLGANRVNWITEQIAGTQQLGTHLDALSHLQIGDRGYNGWSSRRARGRRGRQATRRRDVRQIVTRGWLVDVQRAGSMRRRRDHDRRVPASIRRQGCGAVSHGLGWHWYEPDRYMSGEPGPGHGGLAIGWYERGVALTGCDTWSYGPVPAEDPERPFEVPQFLNARHGVFVVENLDTSELAHDGVREFALSSPTPNCAARAGPGPRRSRSSEAMTTVRALRRVIIGSGAGRRHARASARTVGQANPAARARRLPAAGSPRTGTPRRCSADDSTVTPRRWYDKQDRRIPPARPVLRRRQHQVLRRRPVSPS